MAHTFLNSARLPPVTSTTLTDNPITGSFTPGTDATVVVAMIMYIGTTARGGGTPTFSGSNMTQADSQRYGLSSGEASVEMWYMVSPPNSGSYTISVPNSGTVATSVDMASAKAQAGYISVLDVASGSANSGATSNPYASLTTSGSGDIIFAGVANGAQNWNPSAQTGSIIYNRDNGAWGEGSQYYIQASAGAQTISWTFGTNEDWGVVVAAFKEQYQPTTHNAAASLSPSSEITVVGKPLIGGNSGLTATTALTVIAIKYINGGGSITATSEIGAAGTKIQQGASALSALSEITSLGKKAIDGNSSLSTLSEMVSLSKSGISGYCAITIISELTPNAIKYLNGQSNLFPISEMSSQGILYLNGASSLLATSLLIVLIAGGVVTRTTGVYRGINQFISNVGRIN